MVEKIIRYADIRNVQCICPQCCKFFFQPVRLFFYICFFTVRSYKLCQGGNGRRVEHLLEQGIKGDFFPVLILGQFVSYFTAHLGHKQGIRPMVEKIIRYTDIRDVQCICPQFCKLGFQRIRSFFNNGRLFCHRVGVPCGQLVPVYLTVGCDRQGIDNLKAGRHHINRQILLEKI